MENRIKQLKAEYEAGIRELAELQGKEEALKQMLGRILEAIKVLEAQQQKTVIRK